jgi:ribosome-associated heat shock protein Hsp15
VADDACRIDVWLWRARFCKTRTLASRLAESGRIRLARAGQTMRLDRASRSVKPGDELVFAVAGRVGEVRILALGARRGPPAEARGLYEALDGDLARLWSDLDAAPTPDASGGDDPSARH